MEGDARAVLLLHGFTGMRVEDTVFDADGNEIYTLYGHTADALAEAGIASLRIDFRGSSESIEQMGSEGTTPSRRSRQRSWSRGRGEADRGRGDQVFDVFAGNGAPALDDAVFESVDWFVSTLR